MSGIQRWTPELVRYFNKVGPCLAKHEIGSYVLWTDHVEALQAARPQPKFAVGDRVQWDKDLGTVAKPDEELYPRREPYYVNVNWDDGNFGTVRSSDLTLYVAPVTTSLREHESVRYEDHVAAVKDAVLAEQVRCLEIVENIHGVAVGRDGYRWLDPRGESISRSRVETAIRWVKVK